MASRAVYNKYVLLQYVFFYFSPCVSQVNFDISFVQLDVDECLSQPCTQGFECINTVGSYWCRSRCSHGYHISGDESSCIDVDECHRHPCGEGQTCLNLLGSYRCDCPTGYNSIGTICFDVDECQGNPHPCGDGQQCVNLLGSYRCDCPTGYDSVGRTCVDVDECQRGHRCGDGQVCHNLHGSYRCDCPAGYQYNILTMCVDVDECQLGLHGCGNVQLCHNEQGSYHCDCPAGYQYNSISRTCVANMVTHEMTKAPISAFSAVLATPYPESGTPIKFDQVLYNGEKHYDTETGFFTCKIPGLYYFAYHMHVNGAHALVALYKNGQPMTFTYDEYNKGFLDQMSGSAVLMLNAEDTVYIQIPDDEANGVFAAENVHCSFSGFLIAST